MGYRNILPVFMLLILLIMFYIFMEDNKTSRQSTEQALFRAISNLQVLQDQNSALISIIAETKNKLNSCDAETKKLKSYLMKATATFEKMAIKSKESIPSMDEELARREIGRSTVEFLRYLVSMLHVILKLSTDNIQMNEIARITNDSLGFQRMFKNNMYKLTNTADGHEEWRRRESEKLGNLVQKRLEYLQNPEDCDNVKKMFCNLKQCGFGCQLHNVAYCLIMAYATHRTLVLHSSGWWYAKKGWATTFLPLGKNCSISKSPSVYWKDDPEIEKAPVVELPGFDFMNKPPRYIPLAVPSDLVDSILHFHGDPAVWWVGQIVKYAIRPNPDLEEFLATNKKKLEFKNPIVGIQVRRTDKLDGEAQLHSIEEYMEHVNEWYEMYEKRKPVIRRRVYIATDDPGVYMEASEKYPQYTFVYNKNASMLASLKTRYSEDSLRGVILDINMLSMCDFIVCAFSSQVCRAAYELMQTRHGDASQRFKSLDDVYYFGGQKGHRLRMIENHSVDINEVTEIPALNDSDIDMQKLKDYHRKELLKKGKKGQKLYPGISLNVVGALDAENVDQLEFAHQMFKQKTFGMTDLYVSKNDEVEIHGNLWNGFSIGKNVKSKQIGYFPSYKAVDIIQQVKMPTYPEVPES